MPDKHLYEYAVVRLVPKVEREEFMNVGVILYCKPQRFLGVLFSVNQERVFAFCPELDSSDVMAYLKAFEQICKGGKGAGPIGQLELPSRFRWLTATRSTVVQTSKVHPGFCTDPAKTLQQLYEALVL